MKIYHRESKKWLTPEEIEKYKSRKDKKLCRGKKPHDYVLVLPSHVQYNSEIYKFNPEEYYKVKDEIYDFIEKQNQKLVAMGIKVRCWNRKETRLYGCTVCKKLEYVFID